MIRPAHYLFPLLLTLLTLFAGAQAHAEEDLLEPEVAFPFKVTPVDARSVRADLGALPGYYLYRDRIRFEVQGEGVTLDAVMLPPGKR
jgi:thiol:disulfide interchange protein DsbD